MLLRVIKIVFGILIIKSSIGEYFNFIKQVGHGSIVILVIAILISLFGLILIYSGIKNAKFIDIFRRKPKNIL